MQARGAAADGNAVAGGRGAAEDVPLWRLYVLRACYAILAIGLGSSQMSAFLHHAHWTQNTAAAHSFLLALATLSVVGVRHPLRMLPLLVYELLWKMIWLVGVALPLWATNQVDSETRTAFFQIAPAVVLFPVLPWGFMFSNYLKKPGDRWR
jgi:hypothetical protein